MLGKGASDLDMGGPACNGSIWLRIDGRKRKHLNWVTIRLDQANVLLLSLLTETQRIDLFGSYSLDHSRQLQAGPDGGTWYRYRTSMYFDNEYLGFNIRAISNGNPTDRQYWLPPYHKTGPDVSITCATA